ncbi:MAG: DUF58 domain-containing protein [Lachnospiraceae bacterium]|nr:DUF58 domain-containing protein [Lachnospiraceae bacterium]
MRLIIALACAALLYLIQYKLYKKFWNKNLDVDIDFDREVLYEGEENTLREVITNGKRLPLPVLQIKFSITRTFLFERKDSSSVTDKYYRNEFYTVMPFQKITRTYPFVCSHRGLYGMESMDVICRSLFLDEKMIESRQHAADVCVLPSMIAHKDVTTEINNLLGEIEKNVHINDDPFTFAGIRDYQPYDNMHSINWKVTARLNDLQVNTYNTTFSKKVVVLINTETNSMQHQEDMAEWCIRIAMCIVRRFITSKIPVGLYTNGLDYEGPAPEIEAGADMSHIRTVELALARIDVSQKPTGFAKLMEQKIVSTSGNVEYLIVSNNRKPDVTGEYKKLLASGHRIHFIVPEYEMIGIENEFKTDDYTGWIIKNEDKTY